LCLKQGSWS